MLRRLFFFFLLAIPGWTLAQDVPVAPVQRMAPDPNYRPTLDVLPSIPADVPACGCRLGTDEAAFAEGRFIFAGGLLSPAETNLAAFVMVSGTYLRLERTSFAPAGDMTIARYASDPYILILEFTSRIDQGQTIVRGTLTFEDPFHGNVTQPVYGTCGC
jgi:hypothetical protein